MKRAAARARGALWTAAVGGLALATWRAVSVSPPVGAAEAPRPTTASPAAAPSNANGDARLSVSTRPDAASVATAEESAEAPPAGIEVREIAFAADVSSMTPVGRGDSFDAAVGTVYCWNRIAVERPPAKIKHIWYHDGIKAAEFTMTLRFAHSRVWTHKKIAPGQWRVDVTDENGAPIAVAAFPVRPGK